MEFDLKKNSNFHLDFGNILVKKGIHTIRAHPISPEVASPCFQFTKYLSYHSQCLVISIVIKLGLYLVPFLQKCQAPLHGTETKSIKLQKFREFLQSCHLCITQLAQLLLSEMDIVISDGLKNEKIFMRQMVSFFWCKFSNK